jgi:hypothetical protein
MAVPFSAWASAHIGIIGTGIQRPERVDFRAEWKAGAEGADRRIERRYPNARLLKSDVGRVVGAWTMAAFKHSTRGPSERVQLPLLGHTPPS